MWHQHHSLLAKCASTSPFVRCVPVLLHKSKPPQAGKHFSICLFIIYFFFAVSIMPPRLSPPHPTLTPANEKSQNRHKNKLTFSTFARAPANRWRTFHLQELFYCNSVMYASTMYARTHTLIVVGELLLRSMYIAVLRSSIWGLKLRILEIWFCWFLVGLWCLHALWNSDYNQSDTTLETRTTAMCLLNPPGTPCIVQTCKRHIKQQF